MSVGIERLARLRAAVRAAAARPRGGARRGAGEADRRASASTTMAITPPCEDVVTLAATAGVALPARGERRSARDRHAGRRRLVVAGGQLRRLRIAAPGRPGQLPVGLEAGDRRERVMLEGLETLGAGLHGHQRTRSVRVLLQAVLFSLRRGAQPTLPSMLISMSLLSSRAYSIGSSRAIGSMKPRTIMAIASSSGMPRDCR